MKKKKQKTYIVVTQHAIQRYVERTRGYDLSLEEIHCRLRQAVTNGKRIAERRDNAWEVEGNNLILVVMYTGNVAKIITCLGTKKYRNWTRTHDRVA